MKETRVVITGMGIVAPNAHNAADFWKNLKNRDVCYENLESDEFNALSIKAAGKVGAVDVSKDYARRFTKKCDNMSLYALKAVKEMLDDAGLDPAHLEDRFKIGIMVGNNSGGWRNAQEGLATLHTYKNGNAQVSPYLASNWFPAATQGHISLYYDIKGYSKTVIADRASSMVALGYAYRTIKSGRADYIIAGGTESLIVPWGLTFYQTTGKLNQQSYKSADTEGLFKPFSSDRSGLVVAEGAAFLLLESLESAQKRQAPIYGEICGFGLSNDGAADGSGDSTGYEKAVSAACIDKDKPECVILDGMATEDDDLEVRGMQNIFGKSPENMHFTCPKAFYGNSFGAAAAMETITMALMMEHDHIIPAGKVQKTRTDNTLPFVLTQGLNKSFSSGVVVSRGFGGINSALYMKKYTA